MKAARGVSYGGKTPYARIYERLRKRAQRRPIYQSDWRLSRSIKDDLRAAYIRGVREALDAAQEEVNG